ncbi:DUF3320 domain-containing protein [Streptomyces sp. PA03-6a]|nr:DUF3320 domain-containing protein [Streptomyces sp. PA03-6a]
MGGRNRLLNFRHTRTATLELTTPDASALLAGLARGLDFAPVEEELESADMPPRRRPTDRSGLVTQKATQAALDAALNQLRQKSGQMYNDYGLWVLWLGVGMLDWREMGAHESSAAPLLLVPVELRRDGRGRTRLHLADDQDRIHNPALAVKLDRLGVDWTAVAQSDVSDFGAVLAAARRVAAGQQGWSVGERVVLGLFASYKEAMYQDLQQNEEQILAHPLVRAVGLGPDAGLPDDLIDFEPPELDRIDEIQLPERTPLVLDADASQRQCIAAALDGRSFVVSGPPGTGKSQTITNMIASLMHTGRSVLFVSEKAAALDVVRNRLRSVGLGDFVMALHSGSTTKRAVATELARVLTTEARVTGAAEHELDQARRLREELSAYAAAMNQTREPLQRTLHDVLGRLVLLEQADTPQLPLSGRNTGAVGNLSAAALQELITAAGAVSRAWRPAAEGEAFAWRGLVGASALTIAEEAADALRALRAAAERRPFATALPEPRTVHDLKQLVRTLRAALPARPPEPAVTLPEDLSTTLAQLADLFGLPKPGTPESAFALLELADLTSAERRPPRQWFASEPLGRAHQAAGELRSALTAEAEARRAAEDVFGEQVLTFEDLPALVQRFAEQHRGMMARFSAQYKADRAAAVALSRSGIWDKSLTGRLEQALTWQRATAEAARLAEAHRDLLAHYTPRALDDLADLDQALATADRIAELRGETESRDLLASHLADDADPDPLPGLLARSARDALSDWCDAADQRATRWSESATELLQLFDAPRRGQLSPAMLGALGQAQQAVGVFLADPRGPEEWQTYRDAVALLDRHGAGDLALRAAERTVPAEQFPAVVEQAVLKAWADALLASDSRLRTTRSADLDARVASFQEADRRLVAAAGGAVIEACNRRRPRRFGNGASAVITREAEKKTRHMPVRELLGRTREVVQTIKPCFMMSPLTVSQFLPADYHFDVVIFDEASQVRPSDAINCIYRGSSLVVAGDSKQLPPTSFFDSSVEDDSDQYDQDGPDSFESLLDACKAGAMRELPLRWHYRSRHEDLITFSNRSFYDNSMITFPGALDHGNDVGVSYLRATGAYDRGGRRDNRIEAALVAERVIHHFDTRPGRTLGVVALSQAQASAIDQAVQQARLHRPDLDHCFTEDRLDGFFVKNLESVQGDERDAMIMSIGYGPDEHGKLATNFGPINRDGGWRRLNVAVTRARYRMEVVASFHGTALADSQKESVQHLKRYLEYAENGPAVLAHDIVRGPDETESPFEESVLKVLRGWGYDVQPQVGVAGFRIDLGLRHPDAPGSYALGIECDGAMYHSSKAARDRDRLREQVLAGLGWRLYRIWGTDWYRGRTAAELRLREAVEQAVARRPLPVSGAAQTVGSEEAGGGIGRQRSMPPDARPAVVPVEPERVPVDTEPERPWSAMYEVCDMTVSSLYELHTPEARPQLKTLLTRVIAIEGPIHEELLVQRAREAWGVARAGNRIRDNVREVVGGLERSGMISVRTDFLDVAGRDELKARHPDGDDAPRKAAHIAAAERQLALYELAAECPGMSRDELIREACDFFGWRRIGRDIRGFLETDIADLYGQGKLMGSDGGITAVR